MEPPFFDKHEALKRHTMEHSIGDGRHNLPEPAERDAIQKPNGRLARIPIRYTGISVVAPDIDENYEELKARGVPFEGPVSEMPWGMRATWFYDPDGNEFFLVSG